MKRLHYNKSEEKYLDYNEKEPVQYLEAAGKSLLPHSNLVLLKQMTGWARFVEALLSRVTFNFSLEDIMREETEIDTIDCLTVLNVAWRWHTDIISRKEPLTSHYAYAYMMSWSCFCQSFIITIHNNVDRLEEIQKWPAEKYVFYQEMSQLNNIEISSDIISQYNVTILWDSMKFFIIYGAYNMSYSNDMKRYIHALFYRYCSFLTVKEEELEVMIDNPLFIQEIDKEEKKTKLGDEDEAYDAYKLITIPVTENYHLTSNYLFEGEILFYHQFYRITLSDILCSFYEEDPILLSSVVIDDKIEEYKLVWFNFVTHVCSHSRLDQFIVNDFKKDMMSIYLYHGEKERYQRTWPEANSDPNDILNQTRPDDQIIALEIQNMIPTLILSTFKEKGIYEKESIFITFLAIKRWFAYREFKNHGILNELLILEEFYELNQINLIMIRKNTDYPLLIRFVSTYYVILGRQIYKSTIFFNALFLWINLMSKREAGFERAMHKLLLPIIQDFNVI